MPQILIRKLSKTTVIVKLGFQGIFKDKYKKVKLPLVLAT